MTPFDALLDGVRADLHAHIDRRCAEELLRARLAAIAARRSLGQSFRWIASELTGINRGEE